VGTADVILLADVSLAAGAPVGVSVALLGGWTNIDWPVAMRPKAPASANGAFVTAGGGGDITDGEADLAEASGMLVAGAAGMAVGVVCCVGCMRSLPLAVGCDEDASGGGKGGGSGGRCRDGASVDGSTGCCCACAPLPAVVAVVLLALGRDAMVLLLTSCARCPYQLMSAINHTCFCDYQWRVLK
jgi:hypothetical protein